MRSRLAFHACKDGHDFDGVPSLEWCRQRKLPRRFFEVDFSAVNFEFVNITSMLNERTTAVLGTWMWW